MDSVIVNKAEEAELVRNVKTFIGVIRYMENVCDVNVIRMVHLRYSAIVKMEHVFVDPDREVHCVINALEGIAKQFLKNYFLFLKIYRTMATLSSLWGML